MAEFPAMPFWFDAYYGDTDHLTFEEHGVYLKLLSLLWRAPGQRIPDDKKYLQKRFKKNTRQASKLIREFCQRDGKWITQDRLSREFQFVAEKSEKQRNRVKSRWDKEIYDTTVLPRQYHGSTTDIPPTPTPTPTPIKKERKEEGPRADARRGPHLIPVDWKPNESHHQLASQLGLSMEQVESAFCEMRDWSKGGGNKRTDWDAVFNNWMRRNAQKAYKPNGKHAPPAQAGFVAMPNTPEFEAWRTYARDTGKQSFVRVLDGRQMEGRGFEFETQWPPHAKAS